MKDTLIHSGRVEIAGDRVIAELSVQLPEGEDCFFSLVEVDGIPNLFRTGESTVDFQLRDSCDEAQIAELNACAIEEICDYEDIFGNTDSEWYELYRLLTALVRCDEDATAQLLKEIPGKYLGEISVPATDVEEDWLEM